MKVTKQEEIAYLSSILKRYEREENADFQAEELLGCDKFIKCQNKEAWKKKQRKIDILKAIIGELEGNGNEKQ